MAHFHMWIKVHGWQVKLCDPSLTRANLGVLQMSIAHVIKPYTNVMFTFFYLFQQSIKTIHPNSSL